MDKEISGFHKSLGRLADIGDAVGEFGKRAKPVTDRIKDVTGSLKLFKQESKIIEKDGDPLQIPDLSDED